MRFYSEDLFNKNYMDLNMTVMVEFDKANIYLDKINYFTTCIDYRFSPSQREKAVKNIIKSLRQVYPDYRFMSTGSSYDDKGLIYNDISVFVEDFMIIRDFRSYLAINYKLHTIEDDIAFGILKELEY